MSQEDNQLYIDDIQKALKNGNAVVMIGAGFSLNAHNGHHLKDWFSIGLEFKKAIEGNDAKKPSSAQEVISLGEQYEALFGRTKFNNILKKMLPDTLVSPNHLHEKLLELPWNDVFTTNYDTLLERAADNLVLANHKYFPVYNAEDLPQSRVVNTKRIIKLHGSFPSNEPFIFTTEDYRTYPQKFAPFINTVKQALLENTMCLIGFSGADPNFLQWVGWIRDILNKHSLPIYLMVGKMPSEGEQRVLASRRITPVLYPRKNRNLDRISDRISDFLDQINPNKAQKDWAASIDGTFLKQLKKLHTLEGDLQKDSESAHKIFSCEFDHLKSLRESHPEWLITPMKSRNKLKYNNISRLKIFKENHESTFTYSVFSENLMNRIIYYSYFFWINDILLEAIETEELEKLFSSFIADFKFLKSQSSLDQIMNEQVLLPDFSTEIELYITRIVISFLSKLRRMGLCNQYSDLVSVVKNSSFYCDTIKNEVTYQNTLKELYFGNHTAAKNLLESWDIQQGEFLAQLRKSNLLLEVGYTNKANILLHTLIRDIRLLQRHQTDGAYLISLEACALETISRAQSISTLSSRFIKVSSNKYLETDTSEENTFSDKTITFDNDQDFLLKNVKKQYNNHPKNESNENTQPYNPSSSLKNSKYDINHEILLITSNLRKTDYLYDGKSKGQTAYSLLMLYDKIGLSMKYPCTSYDMSTGFQAGWYLQELNIPISVALDMVHRLYDPSSIKHRENGKPIYSYYWFNEFQLANTSDFYIENIFESLSVQIDHYCNMTDDRNSNKFHYDVKLYTLIATKQGLGIKFQECFKKIIELYSITIKKKAYKLLTELDALKNSISLFLEKADVDDINKVLIDLILLRDLLNTDSQAKNYQIDLFPITRRIEQLIIPTEKFPLSEDMKADIDRRIKGILLLSRDQIIKSKEIPYLMWLCQLNWISLQDKEKINEILWKSSHDFIVFDGFYYSATWLLAEGTIFENQVLTESVMYMEDKLEVILKKTDLSKGDNEFYEDLEEVNNILRSLYFNLKISLKDKGLTLFRKKQIHFLVQIVFVAIDRRRWISGISFEGLANVLDKCIALYIISNYTKRKSLKIQSLDKDLKEYKKYLPHTFRLLNLCEIGIPAWNIQIEEISFQYIDLPTIMTEKSFPGTEEGPTIVELVDMIYFWYQINIKSDTDFSIDKLIDTLLVQMSTAYDLEYLLDRCQILRYTIISASRCFQNEAVKEKIQKKLDLVVSNIKINTAHDQYNFGNKLHLISHIQSKVDNILFLLKK